MPEWLFDIIGQSEPSRRPDFARMSALNWMHALSSEIDAEHGRSVEEQWRACQANFESVVPRDVQHLAAVFEPLFGAITYATSLASLAQQTSVAPWRCPGAIVEWYYAIYGAMRAILSACDQPAPDKHARVADALNGQIRERLPHPFDLHAVWLKNEDYRPELPHHPMTQARLGSVNPLTESFNGTRQHAQEMLLAYTRGTARYYVADIKQALLGTREFKKAGWHEFKAKAPRAERDRRLAKKELNILHLAFRYRGKSNYRDAIFLAYGAGQPEDGLAFVTHLANVARFATLCALAYVERRCGPGPYESFRQDLREQFRGGDHFRAELPRL